MDLLPKSSLQSTKVQRTFLLPVSFLKLLDEFNNSSNRTISYTRNRKAKILSDMNSLRNNFPSETDRHDTVENI